MLFLKTFSLQVCCLSLDTFSFWVWSLSPLFLWIYKVSISVSSRKKRLLLLLLSFVSEVGSGCFLQKLMRLCLHSLLDMGNLVAEMLLQHSLITLLPLRVLLRTTCDPKLYHTISKRKRLVYHLQVFILLTNSFKEKIIMAQKLHQKVQDIRRMLLLKKRPSIKKHQRMLPFSSWSKEKPQGNLRIKQILFCSQLKHFQRGIL